MEAKQLKLSPPWVTFAHELSALFTYDKEVQLVFDQVNMKIKLYVNNAAKAEALDELLRHEAEFGSVKVTIDVVPCNAPGNKYVNQYKTAFDGNSALKNVVTVDSPFGALTYIVWGSRIAQFFDDDMSDYYGNKSMLLQDIAADVLAPVTGVFHCTENVGRCDGSVPWTEF